MNLLQSNDNKKKDSYPVSPSSMFNEHFIGITSFPDFGQLGCSYEPTIRKKKHLDMKHSMTNEQQYTSK